MPGAFKGHCQTTLVLGAGPGLSPGVNTSTVGDVAPQSLDILVVNNLDLVHTKGTYSAAMIEPGTSPPSGGGTTT